ncbi:MAG: orotidine-5'-phosphate decarboxylase [Rhodothermales bacterium]|nr:orotidine-5'-phosphate decarboxylase [Rhodothermales bacterium]
MPQKYSDRLADIQQAQQSTLCVGLDPDPDRLPSHLVDEFGVVRATSYFIEAIVDATLPFCAAYKINFAFFEALGPDGLKVLADARRCIPADRIALADAKRGDIGNTARFYARSVFEEMGFDAITISPYMGSDSVTPFLEYTGKGSYVLVRTSNKAASDIQLMKSSDNQYLYTRVARLAQEWSENLAGSLGFVMGASDIEALVSIRSEYPDRPLLIPGVGAQGGDIEQVVSALQGGDAPYLINSSRGILYASSGSDFAEMSGRAARKLRDQLRD